MRLIILGVVLLLGGGGGLSALLGGGSSGSSGSGAGSLQNDQAVWTDGSAYENYSAPSFGSHSGYSYGNYPAAGPSYDSYSGGTYGSSASGGSSLLEALLGGSYAGETDWGSGYDMDGEASYSSDTISGSSGGLDLSSLADLFGSGMSASTAGMTTGWNDGRDNRGRLDTSVAQGSRRKYTKLLGDGKDTVTVMIYMCGADLESGSGMATADLSEMAGADLSDQVNVIVYTGGCSRWKNSVVSASVNQIYRVRSGGLERLVEDDGDRAMTDPATLSRFIRWCKTNFPANRNELIFWDHGSGSLSGYGYDQKHSREGSMDLAEISEAIRSGGVTFDFVGFDACLMATVENALSLSACADYLLASEETEPGTGWYYTDWLTRLSEDPGMDTTLLGKQIIDDFVEVSARQARGQSTTLSLVDLAELEHTLPQAFSDFSKATGELIRNQEYKTVSTARSGAREFAATSRIDQVDLTDLAWKIGNEESMALVDALLGAIKYNRTSSSMCNSYGLSIYFPSSRLSKVDTMVGTYRQLGLDEEYTRCIQQYATMQAAGQTVSGGSGSVYDMLSGSGNYAGGSYANPYAGSSGLETGTLMDLVSSLLGGRNFSAAELDRSNTQFLSQSGLSTEEIVSTLETDLLDASSLIWSSEGGRHYLHLSEEQWSQVASLEVNLLYDDGAGYIDLGYDNVFQFDEAGDLIGETDRTWLSIDGSPVAYYHMGTVQEGEYSISMGRVPALLNGERVDLLIVFDAQNPYGYIAGARAYYANGETQTFAKGMAALQDGDTLDFLCDYYTYDGDYEDSYFLGDRLVVSGSPVISNTDVGDGGALVTYRVTDLYGQQYFTEALAQ